MSEEEHSEEKGVEVSLPNTASRDEIAYEVVSESLGEEEFALLRDEDFEQHFAVNTTVAAPDEDTVVVDFQVPNMYIVESEEDDEMRGMTQSKTRITLSSSTAKDLAEELQSSVREEQTEEEAEKENDD